MDKRLLIVFCILMSLLISACGEQEAKVEETKPAPKETVVVVPDSVVGQWKSVKIALHDQQQETENIYQVDIGGSFQIPGSKMRVKVESFMPAFAVNSERATSASNQLTNPAVQIVVNDGEQEIHRDWVFGLYPDRHQFVDPRYKILLLDYKAQR